MRNLAVILLLFIALAAGGLLWLRSHDSDLPASVPAAEPAAAAPAAAATAGPAPVVIKQPPVVSTRRFDPVAPPVDMPPLPPGEQAECDSNFLSGAIVSGRSRRTDATHATVTITQIRVTLQLNITIWVPDSVTQHVMEHEQGHRQISEHYYQTADNVAARIAATYMGKQLAVTGADLDAEANRLLQQIGADITDEYGKQLNPDPAQLRYDAITDHARNEVPAKDAVAQVTTR